MELAWHNGSNKTVTKRQTLLIWHSRQAKALDAKVVERFQIVFVPRCDLQRLAFTLPPRRTQTNVCSS